MLITIHNDPDTYAAITLSILFRLSIRFDVVRFIDFRKVVRAITLSDFLHDFPQTFSLRKMYSIAEKKIAKNLRFLLDVGTNARYLKNILN